ncbi:WG repeat-containing protein [Sphingobacterium corticibacterium]|uniref:WG repeat-containing protein n=1 Tax=Sphingobacterium corticibacterium TaxID=2484746 RepID=A0A4Q6XQ30_9SPHI|nr:WG repeat-containing protein [Sphingobacterium corticibacterium]RZF62383.1 WG repeat-containing protein [Sphingobacterium corticibacterium]
MKIKIILSAIALLGLFEGTAQEFFYDDHTEKYGVKDKSGNVVVKPKFNQVSDFIEGSGLHEVMINDKYGIVNSMGQVILPVIYDMIEAYNPYVGNLLLYVKVNDKYGFINQQGKIIVSPTYSYTDDKFRDGRRRVGLGTGGDGMDLYGFIDEQGKLVIPCKYKYTTHFSEDLASVEHNGKWGYLDRAGNLVIPYKFDAAGYFSEGLAATVMTVGYEEEYGERYPDQKLGFIDKSGKTVIPYQYDPGSSFTSSGLPVFNEGIVNVYGSDTRTWFLNKAGKRVK